MWRDGNDAFGWGTIVLHWTTAASILGLIVLGYLMVRPGIDPATQFSLYQWHKSFGLTALALAAIWLGWSLAGRRPRPVPTLGRVERRASSIVHSVLFALTVAVPMTGWAVASTSTLNIPTFFFNRVVVPHLPMAKSEAAEALWTTAHSTLAYATAGLVVLHAFAALHHHFWRRDAVLTRMLAMSQRKRRLPGGRDA